MCPLHGDTSMTYRIATIAAGAAIAISALAVSACSKHEALTFSHSDLFAKTNFSGLAGIPAGILGLDSSARAAPANAQTKLAVTHAFTLSMPSAEVEAVQRKDLDECAKLGCTVLVTSLNRSDSGQVLARTSVRVSPQGYDAFARALMAPPARITSHSQTTEDKTIALLDTEKRLEAKTALRDRLLAMLKDAAPKSTADLLAIETELGNIQGEIESTTAQRDYLRTITDTVRVDVTYEGRVAQVAGVEFSPLNRAVREFGETAVSSFAALIYVLAALLPWIPVIALLAWGVRRSWRRWRARPRAG